MTVILFTECVCENLFHKNCSHEITTMFATLANIWLILTETKHNADSQLREKSWKIAIVSKNAPLR
jgi:hypothetical protein